MQVPKDILRNEAVTTVELDDVLSPESYVFVALMSLPDRQAGMEEGPNKASFLLLHPMSTTVTTVLEGH